MTEELFELRKKVSTSDQDNYKLRQQMLNQKNNEHSMKSSKLEQSNSMNERHHSNMQDSNHRAANGPGNHGDPAVKKPPSNRPRLASVTRCFTGW